MSLAIAATPRFRPADALKLARAVYAAAPRPPHRQPLAALLLQADAFAEVIALLAAADDLSFGEAMTLVHACLAIETPHGNAAALAAALRAEALAESDVAHAAALADRGKAELRLGDAAALDTLHRALQRDSHNRDACNRLVTHHVRANDPRAALALIDALAAQGVGHASLLAGRTLALALLGETEAARAVVGLDRFLHRARVAPPPGRTSLADFHAALAAQLLGHPGLHFERYGTASEQSWRIDALPSPAAPLAGVLLDRIHAAVSDHLATLATLASGDHPWLRARPAAATLHCSCVITDRAGYERWHYHRFAWLSGVHYVQVPPSVAQGADAAGCIAWGLPDGAIGAAAAAAFGETLVRPEAGTTLLFPAHAYHRTFAHKAAERRICIAFDIVPAAAA